MKTNIKYLMTAAVFLLPFSGLYAQIITGGIEGEITTTSIKVSDINNSLINAVNGKNIMGYEVEPHLRFGLGKLYVKPKLLIGFQSGTVQAVYPDQNSVNESFSVTKLDAPILVGLKIMGPLSVEAGPVYSRILTVTKDYNGNMINIAPDGLGYRVGVNAQLGMLGLNVSYQGLKDNSSASNSLSSFEMPDELVFGLSLSFGGPTHVVPYDR